MHQVSNQVLNDLMLKGFSNFGAYLLNDSGLSLTKMFPKNSGEMLFYLVITLFCLMHLVRFILTKCVAVHNDMALK